MRLNEMIERVVVQKENDEMRLDRFLVENLPAFSRSHFSNLIKNKKVKINSIIATKNGQQVFENDEIEIEFLPPTEISLQKEDVEFEIIYEDDDLLVINKPQGLVVHPCSSTKSGTLVNGLLARVQNLSGINGEIRPGIVHRLDKNTSGLMLVAKNDFSHVALSKQISEKICKRKYLALLEGVVQKDEGRIETQIGRSRTDRKKMAVLEKGGKKAITDFVVKKRYEKYTLCEFSLLTGRTHQIRVHAKYMNHPVVGDDVYGKKDIKWNLKGQLLHSYSIEFFHPRTNEKLHFEIGCPNYFTSVLKSIE